MRNIIIRRQQLPLRHHELNTVLAELHHRIERFARKKATDRLPLMFADGKHVIDTEMVIKRNNSDRQIFAKSF